MFPAYVVPPEDITEVLFALSELNDDADQDAVAQFVDESTRKVRESIRVLRELDVVVGDETLAVDIEYDDLVQQLPPAERSAIIERALLKYQPFIDYATYLKRDTRLNRQHRWCLPLMLIYLMMPSTYKRISKGWGLTLAY